MPGTAFLRGPGLLEVPGTRAKGVTFAREKRASHGASCFARRARASWDLDGVVARAQYLLWPLGEGR